MRHTFEEEVQGTFWIDPRGRIHKYKGPHPGEDGYFVSLHYEIAKLLRPELEYPEDFLHGAGWIRVGGCSRMRCKDTPTMKQIETLAELGFSGLYTDQGERIIF